MRSSERKRKRKRATPLGDLVDELLAGCGLTDEVRARRLVTGWRDAVGDQLAAHAWPDGLKAGVLRIRVVSSAWLHQLSFMKDKLVERVNAVTGDPPLVHEVRFHVGARRGDALDDPSLSPFTRRRPPRPRPAPPRPPLTPDVLARIDADTASIVDPELRDAVRAFRRLVGV